MNLFGYPSMHRTYGIETPEVLSSEQVEAVVSFIFASDSDKVFIGSTLFWSIKIRSIVVWLTEAVKAAAKQQQWGIHALGIVTTRR